MTETTHNSSAELHRVSCLRENLTSSSYGEELETGPTAWSGTAPVPYPTTVFKWIKQHLRIKQFYGTSDNAVRTQIWIAVSVYVLVAIVKKRLGLEASLYTLLQVFSVTLFEKMPMSQAFSESTTTFEDGELSNQLNLFRS